MVRSENVIILSGGEEEGVELSSERDIRKEKDNSVIHWSIIFVIVIFVLIFIIVV